MQPKSWHIHMGGIAMQDMFEARTDTSYITLEFAMMELIRKPHVMKKLQEDVRRNVPVGQEMVIEDNLPNISPQHDLPQGRHQGDAPVAPTSTSPPLLPRCMWHRWLHHPSQHSRRHQRLGARQVHRLLGRMSSTPRGSWMEMLLAVSTWGQTSSISWCLDLDEECARGFTRHQWLSRRCCRTSCTDLIGSCRRNEGGGCRYDWGVRNFSFKKGEATLSPRDCMTLQLQTRVLVAPTKLVLLCLDKCATRLHSNTPFWCSHCPCYYLNKRHVFFISR